MSNKKNLSEEDAIEKNDEEGQTQAQTTDNRLEGDSLKKTNNMLGVHTKPLKLVHSTSETNKITGSSDNQTKRQESNKKEMTVESNNNKDQEDLNEQITNQTSPQKRMLKTLTSSELN